MEVEFWILGVGLFLFAYYYTFAFFAFCFSGGQIALWPMNYMNRWRIGYGRVDSTGRDWEKYPEDPYE